MDAGDQFRRRILLVDSDAGLLQGCSDALRSQGYDVISAKDGFEALHVLRGAHPDLLVTELNLPHLSGFELLSVVRTRFPQVSVIATSGDYTPVTVPRAAICDSFITKSANFLSELTSEARSLISQSPFRGSRPKALVAPVWIPRSATGYIVLTCPECLRSFSVAEPAASPANESCIFCGANIRFQISWTDPAAPSASAPLTSRDLRTKSRDLVARSHKLRKKPSS